MLCNYLVNFFLINEKMKIASLYSGCGGMDLGFKLEGFEIVWANDINHFACETYKKKIGNHIVEGSIADVDLSEIPDCEIMLGGFPCQDFSLIWKRRGLETERGNLYKYFVDAVALKEPKIFIAENVKGLLTVDGGKAIKVIEKDFRETGKYGYDTTINLVNFADYGTPQHRQRVLIIGVRKDLKLKFEMPEPMYDKESYIGARKALEGVEKVPYNNEHQNIQEKTAERLAMIPQGGNYTDIPKDSPYYVKGMISHVYRRLHPDRPSTTIIAAGGGGTWGYHFDEPRPLTNRERARLFGYPDDFEFIGSIAEVRRQIGNSVPPVGIRPIGRYMWELLEQEKEKTKEREEVAVY